MKLSSAWTYEKKIVVLIIIQLIAYVFVVGKNRLIVDLLSSVFLGQLVIIAGYANVLVTVFAFGWPQILLRDISIIHKSDSVGHTMLPATLRRAILAPQVGLLVLALCVFTSGHVLQIDISPEFWVSCVIASITIFALILSSQLEGAGKVIMSRISLRVLRVLIFITFILLMTVSGFDGHLSGYVFSEFTFLIIFIAICWRSGVLISPLKNIRTQQTNIPILPNENMWVLTISGFNALMMSADVLVLQIFEDKTVVANYGIVAALVMLISIGMGATNSIFLPGFGAALKDHKYHEAKMMFKKSIRIASSWTMVTIFALCSCVYFIPNIFGIPATFTEALLITFALGVGHFANASTGPVTNMLFVEKQTKFIGITVIIACLINIAGNVMMIPIWGAQGAAISTAFSTCLIHVVQRIYAQKHCAIFRI